VVKLDSYPRESISEIPELAVRYDSFAGLRAAVERGQVELGINKQSAREYFVGAASGISWWWVFRPQFWLIAGIVGAIAFRWWVLLIGIFAAVKSSGRLALFGLEAPLNTKAASFMRRDLLADERLFATAYHHGWIELRD